MGECLCDGGSRKCRAHRDEWDDMGAALGWSQTRIESERRAAGQSQKVQDLKKVKGS